MTLFRPLRLFLVRKPSTSTALVPVPAPTETKTQEPLALPPPPPSRAERAAKIRQLSAELIEGMSAAAAKAINLGEQLLKDKEAIPHGGWKDYVMYDCGLSMSSAQTYMKLAKHKDELAQLVASNPQSSGFLSQAQALKFLSSAQQKRKQKRQTKIT